MKFKVEPNWHQAIVGMTGSGKTTLVKALAVAYAAKLNMQQAPDYYKIFILDTKHQGDFDNIGKKFDTMYSAVYQSGGSRIVVYEPNEEEDDYVHYEMFLRLIWDRWLVLPGQKEKRRVPAVIVIDELGTLEVSGKSKSHIDNKRTHYWAEIMKRGRGAKVVLWNLTQNPVNMPEDFLRNATAIYTFRLNNPEDRERMAKYTGPEEKAEITDPHGFWVYYVGGMMKPRYIKQLEITQPVGGRTAYDRTAYRPGY